MSESKLPRQRRVRIRSFEAVLAEVERLRPAHRSLRKWTLAQVCRHLADTIHGSMDGFDITRHADKRPWKRRAMLWFTFALGIPEKVTVDPRLTPPEGVSFDESLAALRGAIERYERHVGPLCPHPLFGRMSRRAWDRLHRVHAAHHLGFIAPTSGRAG